jgi:hypothetical protein
MKFSLISLIALALTSTSVMAAAQPAAVEKRAFGDIVTGRITDANVVPMGRKEPVDSYLSTGFYTYGEDITFICFTEKNTGPIYVPPKLQPDR